MHHADKVDPFATPAGDVQSSKLTSPAITPSARIRAPPPAHTPHFVVTGQPDTTVDTAVAKADTAEAAHAQTDCAD
eukprot:9474148-Pyramimonas_sp.AAC.1